MADGNRSAKGKEVVVDDCEPYPDSPMSGGGGGAEPSHRWHGHPTSYRGGGGGTASVEPFANHYDVYASYGAAGVGSSWVGGGTAGAGTSGGGGSYGASYGASNGGASYGGPGGSHAVDRRGGGYGMTFSQENSCGGGGSTPFPSTPHMDAPMYASFPSPFNGAGGISVPHQHARTGSNRHTGAGSSAGHELYRGNDNGGGSGTFPSPRVGDGMYNAHNNGGRPCSRSPLKWSREQLDDLVANSLRRLTIGDRARGEGLVARGRRRLSDCLANHGRQELPVDAGDQNNARSPGPGCRGPSNADPYAGRRLEDVRGTMSSIARNHPGCQFLVWMVAGSGAAAAQQVFEEVAGDIVRLMVHPVAHELVEKLVEYWTDEQITHVLQILAASPDQIVAVARNHSGSKILQMLIGRMARNPGHAELFTGTLARAGEQGMISLIEHADGGSMIMKCLDTFSAYQIRFITVVVASSLFLHRVCRDRHGCNVVTKCIDKAAGDEQLLNSLAAAVCMDGVALAEHGYGNFVVQHVMVAVPEARDWLHATLRGRYVSLSTQAASSHVVQRCLDLFSPEQADEVVGELLACHHWGFTFQQLITDPYTNYVLQSAMRRREIQMHSMLLDAISAHQNLLRDDRIAREVFRELRRLYR
ncbi:putative pumilio homolog 8, chloroplastic [Panicum hallii]|uniref:putative pumilio homolog 8, chloroplastic n=1 Tax=Panicum hallii TaxID=206008 RepID=UPI000DF4F059|nr:putative pumilio homolog 8, chloroplastic [Panicum hallii]